MYSLLRVSLYETVRNTQNSRNIADDFDGLFKDHSQIYDRFGLQGT